MTDLANDRLDLFGLLIGVDCYLPNRLPDGSHYPNLGGCVRDISRVEQFLRSKLRLPPEHILKLTASYTGAIDPPERRHQWPTYENMVAAFRRLAEMARPGEQVYIHFSGHGGRAATAFPDLKGADGLDEVLVPADIGDPTARYLRDVELAHLLKALVDKNLIVTVVLDSCHSGGATRGAGGAVARGIGRIDTTPRLTDSLVAPDAGLAETWRRLSAGLTRAMKPGSGWLLEPRGYVLLAACRASESAYEYPFEGRERNGVLTYWLLDTLKQIGPGLTYKVLHDRILAKVHSQFEQQTPQLQGEGKRVVFGADEIPPHYAATVLQVDRTKQRVLLNAGQAQNVREGAQFGVYPSGTTDFTQVDQRLALAEIEDPGATDAWARITTLLRADPIQQGAQAVLLDPGAVRLRRTLCLVRQDGLPPAVDQDKALGEVERALAQAGSGFVRLASALEPADYQVTVNAHGEYEIWDPAGSALTNLRPALSIEDSNAATRLARRLVHLAKYRNVQELDNRDPMSPLARKLVVELAGVQSDYDPIDPPDPRPFDDPGDTPTLMEADWTFLRMRNDSPQVLNVTVLNLQPDWAISQIYPSGAGAFEPLDPGQELLLPMRASLPFAYSEAKDVIKVFATIGTTDFRWLELPPLDQLPRTRHMARGGATDPLEQLLVAVATDAPRTRNLGPAAYPSKGWVTAQVEARVRRR